MSEQYYALFLDEPAMPAFSSAGKMYVGTLKDIEFVINNMRLSGDYQDSISAWDSYIEGNKSVTHSVAYNDVLFLQPVQIIEKIKFKVGQTIWKHHNIWGCIYNMRFDDAVISQIIIRFDDALHRCIKIEATNFCYGRSNDEWTAIGNNFWGNAVVMQTKKKKGGNSVTSNLLYVTEDDIDNNKNTKEYIGNPDNLIFEKICDEIFADG